MDWIPAISTTVLLALVLWLLRNLIITRLTKSVSHEYDKKIENLKTTLRQSEEAFRAELRAKEAQIDALRTGALSGIINKQAALYQRQIVAVEQIWDAVISLAPAKNVSATMAIVKFDAAAKEAAKDPRFREMFAMMGTTFGMNDLRANEASKSRPFLSQLAWAYYSAYQAIVVHAVIKLKALQSGLEKDYADVEAIKRLVKVALPHQTDFIEKFGPSAFHYLLEELEFSLLTELNNILRGEKSDSESVERAASIIKEAERLMQTNESIGKAE
jgi:hypothetical protein